MDVCVGVQEDVWSCKEVNPGAGAAVFVCCCSLFYCSSGVWVPVVSVEVWFWEGDVDWQAVMGNWSVVGPKFSSFWEAMHQDVDAGSGFAVKGCFWLYVARRAGEERGGYGR